MKIVIPSHIKIGGFIWDVVIDESNTLDEGCFGKTLYAKQKISIDPTTTEQNKQATFLHEIIHSILWDTGIARRLREYAAGSDMEEDIVNAITFGLFQVIVDNDFIQQDKHETKRGK